MFSISSDGDFKLVIGNFFFASFKIDCAASRKHQPVDKKKKKIPHQNEGHAKEASLQEAFVPLSLFPGNGGTTRMFCGHCRRKIASLMEES